MRTTHISRKWNPASQCPTCGLLYAHNSQFIWKMMCVCSHQMFDITFFVDALFLDVDVDAAAVIILFKQRSEGKSV